MTSPLHRTVVCPILVGRDGHLAALEGFIGDVTSRHGRVVGVAGEAGVGKSRLVAELERRAAALGMIVLRANCFQPDRTIPYAPLADLLRALLGEAALRDDLRSLGPTARALVRVVPELAAWLEDEPVAGVLEPESARRQLFGALGHVFLQQSRRQATLVVVEDLHWSDDASLEFLVSFARRIMTSPILLILTYRDDEDYPTLAAFLAELDRERLAHELRLSRLSVDEVDAMVRATLDLGRPTRPGFRDALYALTEGNPFFIEEVLKSLLSADDIYHRDGAWETRSLSEQRVPRTVQEAVRRRSAQLRPETREVLALAAVAGRRFDFAILRELTQQDERGLLGLMKELIGAQLVVEESAEQFAFRHALTRQAVYAGLLARERRFLHQQIAEALERLHGSNNDGQLADLAYHFHQAQLWSKALAYSRRAGERSQALHAPVAAVEHFSRALDAAGHVDAGISPDLYRARATAYQTFGDFERARADNEAALELARTAGDQRMEWQGLIDLGALWAERDYGRTRVYYERALELARRMGDPAARARSLNRLGNWHLNVDEPTEALTCHHEALAIFEGLDDRPGIAETLDTSSNTYVVVVGFATKADYVANARSPEQNARYLEYRKLLEAEPEWHDGEIIYSHVASRSAS